VPAELVVEAVGGEPWTGRRRNLPTGPPSRAHRPTASGARLLSELRPVFSSGSRTGHSADLVTDHSTSDGWRSAGDEPGAWLWIDLEGLWSISTIQLEFGPGPATPYIVECSDDGQDLHRLAAGVTEQPDATLDLAGRRAHAVKVTFPQAPAEVRNIRIHGQ